MMLKPLVLVENGQYLVPAKDQRKSWKTNLTNILTEDANMNIYEELITAGINLDHHESDLYVIICEASSKIVAKYPHKDNVTRFKSAIDGKMWYDIPFAYKPFWTKKAITI